ncbi:MAG: DUF4132 domain-containing protein [Solirubrobacteraceae bacterium]|nr:DUF4132 domain-containing protein [Solirubrobacteraceae bacterium]
MQGQGEPVQAVWDGTSEYPRPVAPALEALDRLTNGPYDEPPWWQQSRLRAIPDVAELLDRSGAARAEALLALAAVAAQGRVPARGKLRVQPAFFARELMTVLTRRTVDLTVSHVAELLRLAITAEYAEDPTPATAIVSATLKPIGRMASTWTTDERATLAPLLEAAAARCEPTEALRLRALSKDSRGKLPAGLVDEGEPVGAVIGAYLRGADEASPAVAATAQVFASLPASGKPGPKWLKTADQVAQELAQPAALTLGLLGAVRTADEVVRPGHDWVYFAGETNEHFLRGVARFAGTVATPELLTSLAATARFMVTVIGGQYGSPRSLKVANAAVAAIADAAQPESIRELLALERTVRHGSLLNQIRKAIDALAAAQGVTRDELLEQAVESHALDADGTRTLALASRGSARITVGARAAALVFVDEDGTASKSFPVDVKEAEAVVLAELREELKGIRKTLAAERHRIDGLLAAHRTWTVADWRRFYVDHPVTGRLTRDVIWTFEADGTKPTVGRPVDGHTMLLDDGSMAVIPEDSTVRLWHPVLAEPTAVGAWRDHCIQHRVVQPVKQAFREIYVITPAERETRVYSNRFAAHVFRQVQARALMKGRGWKSPPLAWWDDGRDVGTATRDVASAPELVAQFWFDPIVELDPDGGDLWPLCASDQVRFIRATDDEPVALEDVAPVVFSEIMRDVDLFVGVTSIGADPEWLDRGEAAIVPRGQEYWDDYAFGALSASAEIRREILEGLLPALVIADRLALEDRFLRVRGSLRTYRIHLGSGNIQMEPNAEYLCIVSARSSKTSKLFLPLDDDRVLTLILSKAFLLAADDQITDPTILDQITRR